MREDVKEVAVGIFLEALRRHGTAGRITDEPLQLIPPMGRDLGVGMQGKALHAGTAGTRERGRLAFGAKAGAHAPDFLASPLPKSDAMLRPGAGDSGGALL